MNEAVENSKQKRKAKTELESRSFKDGAIYLFKRADYKKPTWFCRVKVPNAKGYVSCSTKTTDEHQAFAFANDLFNKTLVKVASGQELNSKKTATAIKEYIVHIRTTESNRASTNTRAQFLEKTTAFFGTMSLKEVTTSTLIDLNDWIVANSRNKFLSPNTIKRYSTDLKQFFNWCLEKDYIDKLPRFPKTRSDTNRRPHFDNKDWTKLTRHLREFVKADYPWIVRDRTMLVNYVLILANTGIRVGEARNLKWRDLREIPQPKGSKRLLNWADTCGHYVVSVQRPDIHLDVDDDKEKAAATRKRFLEMSVVEELFVIGYHMPFPGLGHIERMGSNYRWVGSEDLRVSVVNVRVFRLAIGCLLWK